MTFNVISTIKIVTNVPPSSQTRNPYNAKHYVADNILIQQAFNDKLLPPFRLRVAEGAVRHHVFLRCVCADDKKREHLNVPPLSLIFVGLFYLPRYCQWSCKLVILSHGDADSCRTSLLS